MCAVRRASRMQICVPLRCRSQTCDWPAPDRVANVWAQACAHAWTAVCVPWRWCLHHTFATSTLALIDNINIMYVC